jgi:5'-nucleotidase/UDP-sugar diphosphatase
MKLLRPNYWLAAITLLLLGLMQAPYAQSAWEKDKTYSITVLHTNDHHGHFWHNKKGEYGLAAQKTLVDHIRQQVKESGGNLLVLSGGDVNTGVPESDLLKAEPDFIGMNEVGYDAMAVGNHEFDNPLEVIREQQKWAKFPFLSANIYDKKTGKRLFQPYHIFERQGLKIAVIGLTTEDTAKFVSSKVAAAIEFRDPKAEAKRLIAEVREKEKPDVIIAATHMGHYDDGKHGSNAPGDVELARFLDTGSVDMIVGGHSQEPLCMEQVNVRQKEYVPGTPCMPDNQNGIWIVQAHEWGKYVGRADFTFRNGQMILSKYELIPINLKKSVKQDDGKTIEVNYGPEIAPNQELYALLEPYQKQGEAQLSVQVGKSDVFLEGSRNIVRYQQTNMGKLIIMAQMARTNADFGVISGGGVRDSIDAGPISYSDVLRVQPFGNTVGYVEMSGDELIDYLSAVAVMTPGSGAYPQFANIYFKLNDGRVSDIRIGGKPFEPKKTYRISMPNFNADGGDGYPNVLDRFVTNGSIDAEVLKDYIAKKGVLTEKEFG